ncbi:HAD family hydrolase [Siminovitchia sp. FSL H7-0308]|uniref:Phosphoglycolate phosphatase-like HAD superfamily hydrolase n=1 Tax=Siminovitchia thermophila TaxID=1245522 RepID=A0ABS2R1S8_9BACI|nr:HAD family hydrolase [Siminovitchia thermophila]MBM7713119.1 phosphoglycolate phosphatase-like HAD superfamily hydrolase [Siminovitchia thermophila]ONK24847.1 phosphatase [Bacillus sp. VT-16-64]
MVKTVLFDVDGVLLSEERYFDMSALTVWEVLNSSKYLGLEPETFKTDLGDREIDDIRSQVFVQDQALKFMKACGLNANWDMIYLAVGYQLIHVLEQVKDEFADQIQGWLTNEINRDILLEIGANLKGKRVELDYAKFLDDFKTAEPSKQGLLGHLDTLSKEKLGVDTDIFGKADALWSTCEHASQEWYVGDKYVFQSTGKPSVQTGKAGFMSDEKVLAPKEEIAGLFAALNNHGVRIGVGTGRPELETIEPFRILGWLQHFDRNYIVTADDVLKAERENNNIPALAKPHPFTYILALSGKTKTVEQCLAEKLPIDHSKETLIVGDSLADLLAAREMGCLFAAVLTGLSGQDARPEFEEHQADYILDSVLDVKEIVLSLVK